MRKSLNIIASGLLLIFSSTVLAHADDVLQQLPRAAAEANAMNTNDAADIDSTPATVTPKPAPHARKHLRKKGKHTQRHRHKQQITI